jgi:hypothetical protein
LRSHVRIHPLTTTLFTDEDDEMKRLILFLLLLPFPLVISGCFPGNNNFAPDSPAGFFTGVWHGWIAPISIIAGFFNDNIRVYELNNTGWWYDLGFYMAIISGFGGISIFRKKDKKEHH